jgi:hypothetical protein
MRRKTDVPCTWCLCQWQARDPIQVRNMSSLWWTPPPWSKRASLGQKPHWHLTVVACKNAHRTLEDSLENNSSRQERTLKKRCYFLVTRSDGLTLQVHSSLQVKCRVDTRPLLSEEWTPEVTKN